MSVESSFSVRNLTTAQIPALPFQKIKEKVLGKKYELSLVFVSPARARAINTKYRSKSYAANVLSFPLSKQSGEIFICPATAKKEAPDFDRSVKNFIADLFIHGTLHLKGLPHGSRMERQEARIRTFFKL